MVCGLKLLTDDAETLMPEKTGETVLYVKNMEQLDTTSEEDFHSLYNWLADHNSLAEASGSRDFLLHPEDFVSLSRKQKDKSFEDLAVWLLDRGPMRLKRVNSPRMKAPERYPV
jgi:hypothetical protein